MVKDEKPRTIFPAAAGGNSDPDQGLNELLTVDADAHLQKLTANMFPSPALLPLELVRSALKRGAAAISIRVETTRIEISDDGAGISRGEWLALACLGDSGQDAIAREKALARLQDDGRPGIGMVAVFCPGVRAVTIENSHSGSRETLRIAAGAVRLEEGNTCPCGSRIAITRRRGPAAEERTLLAELCAATRGEIVINGRPLKKRPLLKECLVSLGNETGAQAPPVRTAVPAQGDVCRIWLLDQGIPWQILSLAPLQGMVFSAALEMDARPSPAAMDALAANAHSLYRWLAENHGQFPEPWRPRIEELLFRKARADGDLSLLSLCAPFRLRGAHRGLGLSVVIEKVRHGTLAFTHNDGRVIRSRGEENEVLVLSALQKDFLINHLKLPLVPLGHDGVNKAKRPGERILRRRLQAIILKWLAPAPSRLIDPRRLSMEEQSLCRQIETLWARKQAASANGVRAAAVNVGMVPGRGVTASFRLSNRSGEMLLIKRRHPLTRLALRRLSENPANLELVFAALMPVRPLTDPRR